MKYHIIDLIIVPTAMYDASVWSNCQPSSWRATAKSLLQDTTFGNTFFFQLAFYTKRRKTLGETVTLIDPSISQKDISVHYEYIHSSHSLDIIFKRMGWASVYIFKTTITRFVGKQIKGRDLITNIHSAILWIRLLVLYELHAEMFGLWAGAQRADL